MRDLRGRRNRRGRRELLQGHRERWRLGGISRRVGLGGEDVGVLVGVEANHGIVQLDAVALPRPFVDGGEVMKVGILLADGFVEALKGGWMDVERREGAFVRLADVDEDAILGIDLGALGRRDSLQGILASAVVVVIQRSTRGPRGFGAVCRVGRGQCIESLHGPAEGSRVEVLGRVEDHRRLVQVGHVIELRAVTGLVILRIRLLPTCNSLAMPILYAQPG